MGQTGTVIDRSTGNSYDIYVTDNGKMRINASHAGANSKLILAGSITYVYSEFEEA